MRKVLNLILSMLLLLGSISTAYAANTTSTTDSDNNLITLEQAKSLAYENSRILKQYEINVDKTKYQVQQADQQYDEAIDDYNSIGSTLNSDDEDIDYDKVSDQLESQADKIESSSDNYDDAENNYADAKKAEENYRKQLDYLVEQLYTNILDQEDSLVALKKEYELEQYNLTVERKKLLLGSSNQEAADEQSTVVSDLNKRIIDQTNHIKTNKGQLNDMMDRDYQAELTLTPFEVGLTLELPDYDQLLSNATQSYDELWKMKRDLNNLDDDLEDEDNYYQYLVLRQEIKDKELQLEEQESKLQETVTNLLADAQTKQEAYKLAQNNYLLAQRAYTWAQKRYELGQTSKVALLESEVDCLNKKTTKDSAGYDLFLAKRSLELAEIGIFN